MSEEQKVVKPVPQPTGDVVYIVMGDRQVFIDVFDDEEEAKAYADHLEGWAIGGRRNCDPFSVERYDVKTWPGDGSK